MKWAYRAVITVAGALLALNKLAGVLVLVAALKTLAMLAKGSGVVTEWLCRAVDWMAEVIDGGNGRST